MPRFKKMNPTIKAEWTDALRSGKFDQASGILYAGDNSYCCLGVLQQIVEPENIDGLHGDNGFPTPSCLKTAGLGRYRPQENGSVTELARMNDSGENNFDDIADFIEKNL